MNRDKLIEYLVTEHHKHCCDCTTYREAARQDATDVLAYEYVILFGDGSREEAARLRGGNLDELCQEIAKKKGHTL